MSEKRDDNDEKVTETTPATAADVDAKDSSDDSKESKVTEELKDTSDAKEEKDADDTKETKGEVNADEEKPKKSLVKYIIIGVIVLLVLGGGAGAALMFLGGGSSEKNEAVEMTAVDEKEKKENKEKEEKEKAESEAKDKELSPEATVDSDIDSEISGEQVDTASSDINYYEFPKPLVLNYIDSAGVSRYLQLNISIVTRDSATFNNLKNNSPLLKNNLLFLVGNMDIDKFYDLKEKKNLRAEMLKEINRTMNKYSKNTDIETIYFTDFIIQ